MNSKLSPGAAGLSAVQVTDTFWSGRMDLVRRVMLPYQWEALNDRIADAVPSRCMRNFRIAAGMEKGVFEGHVFQDSDFHKWIEAVGHSLAWHKDQALEATADGAIDTVVAAQQQDGYLDTYYIIGGIEKRFTNLMQNHELYCAGHLIEGAIAYYLGTGKDKLLKAAVRFADCIDAAFGPEEHKLKGYPGHEIIEMALVALFRLTGESRYLKLARFFIDQRGVQPLYFEKEHRQYGNAFPWENSYMRYQYYQAGLPVYRQQAAEGHSVRAVYLYSGMADVALETNDTHLLDACERLWDNMTQRRMYITGGIGSSSYGEAFTYDYDLPPDTAYTETCASIGLVFFARRMLQNCVHRKYADTMELALYNGVISGMSAKATEFFYVNPLEVLPEACEKDHLRHHVKPVRQKWFGCACCPPNLARMIQSFGGYISTETDGDVYLHLYAGANLECRAGGVRLEIKSAFPWSGEVKIRVLCDKPASFRLVLRWPGWCENAKFSVLGAPIENAAPQSDGYVYINRIWQNGDEVLAKFEMPVRVVRANPLVRETIGKIAVCRGPLVYCLEEADNGPGLAQTVLPAAAAFTCTERAELGGYTAITAPGAQICGKSWPAETLYASNIAAEYKDKPLLFIPYYLWANRGVGEMTVWVREKVCN